MDAGWDDDYPLPREVLEAAERYERNASPDRLSEEEEYDAMKPRRRLLPWALDTFSPARYKRRRRHPSPAPSRDTGPGE